MTFDARIDGVLDDPLTLAEFQRLTPELTDFADSHALLVERYKRGFPMWTFMFRHPKGGAASLQLSITVSKDTREPLANIFPHWWQDDEEELRRKLGEFAVLREVTLEASILRSALERVLSDVLHATPAVLTRESTIVARPRDAEGNPQYGVLDEVNLPLPT
jgi:hypothetical protein